MYTSRMEAFSDALIAIIMTIMILELKVPHGTDFEALRPLASTFFCYVLSFIYLAIYWNNHHHMLQATDELNGAILWANMHLLFWLSLIPFSTAWLGENGFAAAPTALYGAVLFFSAVAYYVLELLIIRAQGPDSKIGAAVGRDIKGKVSPVLYLAAVLLAFVNPWISIAIYALVAAMWLVPDSRIETKMLEEAECEHEVAKATEAVAHAAVKEAVKRAEPAVKKLKK